MSLGNQIKKKKETEAKALVNRSVTMPENDWAVLQNHLQLLSENIGRMGLTSDMIGAVHSNCMYFIKKISNENNIKSDS